MNLFSENCNFDKNVYRQILRDDFKELSEENLIKKLDKSFISVRLLPETYYTQSTDHESINADFYIENIKLCAYQANINRIRDQIIITGWIPIDIEKDAFETWVDKGKNTSIGKTDLKKSLKTMGKILGEINSQQKCLWYEDGELLSSVEFNVMDDQNQAYSGIAAMSSYLNDDSKKDSRTKKKPSSQSFSSQTKQSIKIKKFQAEELHITNAKGVIRKREILPDGEFRYSLQHIEIPGILADEYLCRKELKSPGLQANGSEFIIGEDESKLRQLTMFYNASNFIKWMEEYKILAFWPGSAIELATIEQKEFANLAAYRPAYGDAKEARIIIGPGDGINLSNLWWDPEVISHELGHHLIFRKLKSTRGESALIHEAISDYLVMAFNENACLGESVCPINSPYCVSDQCLRNGENQLRFNDPDFNIYNFHYSSQLISGLLWNLGKKSTHQTVAKLAISAIDFLDYEAGIDVFLASLYWANNLVNNIIALDDLLEEICDRDLSELITKTNPLYTNVKDACSL